MLYIIGSKSNLSGPILNKRKIDNTRVAEVEVIEEYGHLVPLEAPVLVGEKCSTQMAGSSMLILWRWESGACGDVFDQAGQEMGERGRERSRNNQTSTFECRFLEQVVEVIVGTELHIVGNIIGQF